MATSKEQLQADLSWDIDRLNVDPDEYGSDAALTILDDIQEQHTVDHSRAYAGADSDVTDVAAKDLLRVLQLAGGRLALVTWSSAGITSIGYRPDEQRFDVGQFSGIDKRMGNEYETYERATKGQAKDLLAWTTPTVVSREEAKLLPQLDDVEVVA